MRLFTEHPNSVGESYFEHMRVAASFGWPMIVAGIGAVLHGIFPFLFEKTGSKAIMQLHGRLVAARGRNEKENNFDPCI
ncbi:DUF6356 family protein [Parerythrobacter aestuarii]|uniref:DUF6356 family protein n=1 Tax=Parerythrobacter aestuarii TaxID=3020909 RepID=UPI0024DE0C05|nr:DUF6356 family protein [Parerythrobacter aestuarii]